MARFRCDHRPRPSIYVPSFGVTAEFDGSGLLDTQAEAARTHIPMEIFDAAVRAHPAFAEGLITEEQPALVDGPPSPPAGGEPSGSAPEDPGAPAQVRARSRSRKKAK